MKQEHPLRKENNHQSNPPAEYFIQQLNAVSPRAKLLWNTYSLKGLPIGAAPFGLTDNEVIWRFPRYYRDLAKITGFQIKPFVFVGDIQHSLHFHSIEIWEPTKQGWEWRHQHILRRIDKIWRKSFPCSSYPKHRLTSPRRRSDTNPDYVIHSHLTAEDAGCAYYARAGHNYIPDLTRVFFP